jgi:hypothetical protein
MPPGICLRHERVFSTVRGRICCNAPVNNGPKDFITVVEISIKIDRPPNAATEYIKPCLQAAISLQLPFASTLFYEASMESIQMHLPHNYKIVAQSMKQLR